MLVLGLSRGFSFFWSPNFDRKPEPQNIEPVLRVMSKEPKKKKVRCKTMQALQRSLSEAQKIGVGVDTLKELIRRHKASCSKCHSSE